MKKITLKDIEKNIKEFLGNLSDREKLKENKIKILKIGCISAALIIAIIGLATFGKGDEDTLKEIEAMNEKNAATDEMPEAEETEDVIVDISGAVKNPMVAQLPAGSRIDDAIKAAGGLIENADISNVNRAQILEDGQKIFIPALGENSVSGKTSVTSKVPGSQKVNINTATDEELRTIDGVGPATAEKIINYREKNGIFKSVEDIKEVDGIGEKTFEKLKDDICV